MREVESQLIGLLNQNRTLQGAPQQTSTAGQRTMRNELSGMQEIWTICVFIKTQTRTKEILSPTVAAADSCCRYQLKVQYVKDW